MNETENKISIIKKNIGGGVVLSSQITVPDVLEFGRYMHRRNAKISRMRIRLFADLQRFPFVYFFTQTFSDETFNVYSNIQSIIQRRFVDSIFDDYFYNFDIGTQTERLHLHGVISSVEDIEFVFDDLGFCKLEPLVLENIIRTKSIKNVTAYISKHSIKDSAAVENIHYKRGVFTPEDLEKAHTAYLELQYQLEPTKAHAEALYKHINKIGVPSGSLASPGPQVKANNLLRRYDIERY